MIVKEDKKSWPFKLLILCLMAVIILFFADTSSQTITYLAGNYVGFFHEIPDDYIEGSGGYYPGFYPPPNWYPLPNTIIYPQVLYFNDAFWGYTGGSGGYYPGSVYSQYYNREGIFNPNANAFLPMEVLYFEGEPVGYHGGSGGYYPGSVYSERYN